MKDFFEKYNNLKQNNRRAVGFSKLGFWIVFFGFMILLAMSSSGTASKSNGSSKSDTNKSEKISSYHFKYNINDKEYSGSYLDNKIELIGQEASFLIFDDKIMTTNLDSSIPNYDYIDINNIDEIINDLEPDSKTSYKDGRVEYTYISKHNEDDMTIKYSNISDKTINIIIEYPDNHLEINITDIDDKKINIDDTIYIYEYNKEDNNEY